MIRNDKDIVVERSGDFDESSFGIDSEDVSLILEIIRNKLYTNKLGSFIREITSNAFDAMVEANTLKSHKIVYTLPNDANNFTLTIRDYGTGMSEEKVKKIYTRVGKSTRSGSNKYVGMMGIGRLVGFCLTDSFNVVSFQDGIRREYLCYIDETKCGKVAMLSETETKEENGIAISVNVDRQFHDKLSLEIQNFTAFVDDVEFKFINEPYNYNFSYIDKSNAMKDVVFKGTDWVKYRERINGVGGYVKMGIVKYPLPEEYLKGAFYSEGTVIFSVPIGDVTVSASREGLEFTPQTTEYVKKLLARAKKEASQDFFKEVKAAKTMKEAIEIYSKLYQTWLALDQPPVMWHNPDTNREIDIAAIRDKYYEFCSYDIVYQVDGKTPELDANGEPVLAQIKHNQEKYEFRSYTLQLGRRIKDEKNQQMKRSGGYYRMVEPHDIESLPDIRRCRTLWDVVTGNAKVYVFTKRGLKHFINQEGYDPTALMLKFDDVVEKVLPRGHSIRPPVQIKKVEFTFDPATNKVNANTLELTEELDNLPPGYWVSRRYSSIIYNRTLMHEIDEAELNGLFTTICSFLKTPVTLYILPANGGRILDNEKKENPTSTDYSNLVNVYDWVEDLLKKTTLLDYITMSTTDLTVKSWEAQQIVNIFKKDYKNVRSPITQEIIDLAKKAIRPHVPGEIQVRHAVVEKIRSFHGKQDLKIQTYTDQLRQKGQALHHKFPLMPESLADADDLIRLFAKLPVYDEYLHSVTTDRELRAAKNPVPTQNG